MLKSHCLYPLKHLEKKRSWMRIRAKRVWLKFMRMHRLCSFPRRGKRKESTKKSFGAYLIFELDVFQHISQVHEIVGRINGRFGTLTAVPIHHLDQSLDFHALCALYAVTDVALVTSLRDGMNLVSYEFVACQVYALVFSIVKFIRKA
ncbi:uncharacterized protein LOC133795505 [Humulus lupulus]|uniref:uncharacterized protein LOC133795505 n=1 Tax=Humulus lupulus TaxID=3486 RepID=UPI002B40D905|nr:uncharacterized protein LOC133795505 [Humulus lupulus]